MKRPGCVHIPDHKSTEEIGRSRHMELNRFHGTESVQKLHTGELIEKRYRVLAELGVGAMGSVYKARDEVLGRDVAIKSPLGNKGRIEETVRYLRRELEALARISHKNVVGFIDLGFSKGMELIVMEYLDGRDLFSLSPLGWEEARPLFMQLCDALQAGHENGVVHGDVKPNNIVVIDKDGTETVKLFDFGTVKFMDAPDGDIGRTPNGEIIGTLYYVSPEMLDGANFDQRTDIFALGITMYQTLSGRIPIPIISPPAPLGVLGVEIPKSAEEAIMRAMENRPEDRFQSAEDMKKALSGIVL